MLLYQSDGSRFACCVGDVPGEDTEEDDYGSECDVHLETLAPDIKLWEAAVGEDITR